MIKVLLVDDEYYIRERLKIIVDWESMGFEIAGEAENGLQALSAIEELEPNLLLLDIKMPEMDGLELAKLIHQRYPDVLMIILTGFDLFEYACDALHAGVVGYLLKPVDCDALVAQLEKARESVKVREQNKWNMLLFRQIQQDDCLNFILFDEGEPPAELKHALQDMLTTLQSGRFLLFHSTDRLITGELKVSIAAMLETLFADVRCYLFQPTEVTLGLCLCEGERPVSEAQLRQLCSRMRQDIAGNIRISISESFIGAQTMKAAYRQALLAMRESVFCPGDIAVYEDAFAESPREAMPLGSLRESMLLELRGGKKQQALEQIEKQFRILQQDYRSYHNLLLLINELNSIAVIYSNETSVFQVSDQPYFQIFLEGYDSLWEIADWFKQTFDSLYELKRQSKTSVQHKIIQQAKRVIEQHYSNPDCNLDFVSREVQRSANYLSGLFKKVCGISVVQYITSCRMAQAQLLLKNTDCPRLTEVCEQVGYNDVFYFSRRFKQCFGVSPSEFS